MNVKCSDLIFQFRSVPLSPRLSSELRTRSKGSPVSSHTAFKVQMDSPVWFPVRHHVVQSAFIQKQRNWFWTLFEVLVRVWTIRRYKNPNVWEWRCQIRADVQSETLFLITNCSSWGQKLQTFHCHLLRKYKNTTKWVFPACFSSYKTNWRYDCALRTFQWHKKKNQMSNCSFRPRSEWYKHQNTRFHQKQISWTPERVEKQIVSLQH